MHTDQIINLIVAIVIAAPVSILIAQAIKRVSWPSGVKASVAMVVCLVVGVAQTWAAGSLFGLIASWGSLTSSQVIAWAGLVWGAATIEYNAYFAYLPKVIKLGEWPTK